MNRLLPIGTANVAFRRASRALAVFLFCAGATLTAGRAEAQTATHDAVAYGAGETMVVTASFDHAAEDELLALAWILDLPDGWTVTAVAGDGTPELDADGHTIVFLESTLGNPLEFTITLDVPAGTTGTQSVAAVAQYWFPSMIDEAEIQVTPNPLEIGERDDPGVTQWPAASSITYGQSLVASTLSSGQAAVDGTFVFADDSLTPPAGDFDAWVLFEPADQERYLTVSNQVAIVIDPRALTLIGMLAVDREYDGTTSVQIIDYGAVTGVVDGDEVFVASVVGVTKADFNDRHVDVDKTVTVAPFFLVGGDAGNYSIAPQTTTGSIWAKPLTVTGSFTALDRPWDGTVDATIDGNSLGLVGVETNDAAGVQLDPVVAFDSSYPGERTVLLTGTSSLSGTFAGNYVLSLEGAPTSTATIGMVYTALGTPITFYLDAAIEPEPGDGWDDVDTYDSDSDGMINWHEYVAGTDPADAASRLIITDITFNPGLPTPIEIEWIGGTRGPAAPYIVESTASLLQPVWRNETNEAARLDGINEWSGTDETGRFYRIRATLDE